MANEAQCKLVAHRIRSALGFNLPVIMENGANRIYEKIIENVKPFTNAQVTQVILLMDKVEEDEVTKDYALQELARLGVVAERICDGCKKPISQCKSC